jgi:hypothetical protein
VRTSVYIRPTLKCDPRQCYLLLISTFEILKTCDIQIVSIVFSNARSWQDMSGFGTAKFGTDSTGNHKFMYSNLGQESTRNSKRKF